MPLSARARSPRALASAVAVALAALSASASAAGLGRLTVQSSLGQPLRAEVEITSVTGDEAASLAARLASAEAFRQAGMEFGATQQNLRFGVERRGDGRYVVRITSAQAINEPFVDLLVELNSSAGRFVREYTFLLDPPELRSVQQAAAASPQDVVVVPQAASAARVESTRSPRATRSPSPSDAAPRGAATPGATGGTITVQRGDTLAAIARRVRPADASVEQVAAALYRANPGAFGGSPDRLRAGATLNVPEAAVDAAEARRELRMRAQDFQSYRDRLAAAPRQTEPARAGQSATGRIGARVEDRAEPAANADQLRLSRGAGGTAAAGAAGSQASRAAATEQGYARDAALAEVDARMRQLERNLADLQKLVELKDQSLATMQRQLEQARSSPSRATPAAVDDPASASAPAASSTAAPGVSAPASPNGPSPQPPMGSVPAGDATAAVAAGSAGENARSAPADPAPASAGAPPQPPVAAPASAASAPVAPPAAESLLDNEYLLPGLGGLALLGAGYAWLAVRRRRQADRHEDEASAGDAFAGMPAYATVDDPHEAIDDAAGGPEMQPAAETQATEVDPIAEAEIYIAYGREQQAEDILREALRQQPDRQPVRAKLLEIYAGRQDPIGFGELAGEMYLATQGLNPEWPQVASTGRSIDPGNPLYASGEQAVAPEETPSGAADTGVGALAGLPIDEPDRAEALALTTAAGSAQPEDEVAALDFELDLDTSVGRGDNPLSTDAQPIEAIVPVSRPTSDLAHAVGGDFELPSLELDEIGPDSGQSPEAARLAAEPLPEIDLSGISLDLDPLTTTGQDGDSARWQEMSTKLDLAAAYDEIGDREGARELLDEVVRDGDTQQQQRARSMLASFA